MSTALEGSSDPKHSDSGLVVSPTTLHDSEEYESAEEVYDDDEEVEIEVEVEEEEDEEGADGAKEKELDDDEDRQNPQFIPKKGYFYEHDDRTKTEDENEEPEKEVKEEKPKKVVKEVDRWSHDCFDEHEQGQKSNEELVRIYGYNIREEDQPPKAVRRRRYGRGPKKYTRKSEDGEAYQKPRGGYSGRGRRGGGGRNFRDNENGAAGGGGYEEEFPQLRTDRPPAPPSPDDGGGDRAEPRSNRSGRGGGRPPRGQNRSRDSGGSRDRPTGNFEENRNQSYNNNDSRGRRGGGTGGSGGGRRHRNEFTNRNRYSENRYDNNSTTDSRSNQNLSNSGSNFTRKTEHHSSKDADFNTKREKPWQEHDTTRGKVINETPTSTTPNSSVPPSRSESTVIGDKNMSSLQQKGPAKPVMPFTNTEYTGSASLTATSKPNVSNSSGSGSGPSDINRHQDFEQNSRNRNTTRVEGELERNVEPPRIDPRIDSREVPRPKSYNANERRPQIPLRLQQQQRHENLQQQQQQQLDQTNLSAAGKPKRFSTQRQRQVVDTSSLQQTSMPSQMIPQVVPVQPPVVTVAGSMVTSPPSYPPPQTYYDAAPPNFDAQVYENTGSPMAGNGPASVSPSLWGPHAVPPSQVQYADPNAFIAAAQPPGPPIFAAPPQFIQDAAMQLNFAPAPPPPFAPPYQGYQGYAQVTPAPPPEVYHAGVTYYNTQNQIQRPPVMAVQKRPKSVLQLVEPPEKLKQNKDSQMQPSENRRDDSDPTTAGHQSNADIEANLSHNLANLSTQEVEETSDIRGTEGESWASQMDQTSPTDIVPPPSSIDLKPVAMKEVASVPTSRLSPEVPLQSTPAVEIEAQKVNENVTSNVSDGVSIPPQSQEKNNDPVEPVVEPEKVDSSSSDNIQTSETGKSDTEEKVKISNIDVQPEITPTNDNVQEMDPPKEEATTTPLSGSPELDSSK